MNKKIGIFTWKLGDNSIGITTPYYGFIDSFGDPCLISPVANPDLSNLDLIIIPGGPDIAPNRYGYVPDLSTSKSDPIREYFDAYIIPKAIKEGIPLFGICRGHQALAVLNGFTLIQHMYHETNESHKRFDEVHEVVFEENSLPFGASKSKTAKNNKREMSVNSIHHQVVRRDNQLLKANEIEIVAVHKGTKTYPDNHIEALYYPRINAIGVQWHPEEIYDEFSNEAIKYLLSLKKNKVDEDTDK
jgi:gamma-glutamyl-gamma-aminobutyrate hydrolase PuuD